MGLTEERIATAAEGLATATDYADIAAPSADVTIADVIGAPCRAIMPLATGALVVVNLAGVTRELAVTKNVFEPIQAVTITSATAVAVRVYR